MTAGGGWEKVLQVWWARCARATGNVAALWALRSLGRGPRAGGRGLGVARASPAPEGGWTLRAASRQWEPLAAKRVGGRAHPPSASLGQRTWGGSAG